MPKVSSTQHCAPTPHLSIHQSLLQDPAKGFLSAQELAGERCSPCGVALPSALLLCHQRRLGCLQSQLRIQCLSLLT